MWIYWLTSEATRYASCVQYKRARVQCALGFSSSDSKGNSVHCPRASMIAVLEIGIYRSADTSYQNTLQRESTVRMYGEKVLIWF